MIDDFVTTRSLKSDDEYFVLNSSEVCYMNRLDQYYNFYYDKGNKDSLYVGVGCRDEMVDCFVHGPDMVDRVKAGETTADVLDDWEYDEYYSPYDDEDPHGAEVVGHAIKIHNDQELGDLDLLANRGTKFVQYWANIYKLDKEYKDFSFEFKKLNHRLVCVAHLAHSQHVGHMAAMSSYCRMLLGCARKTKPPLRAYEHFAPVVDPVFISMVQGDYFKNKSAPYMTALPFLIGLNYGNNVRFDLYKVIDEYPFKVSGFRSTYMYNIYTYTFRDDYDVRDEHLEQLYKMGYLEELKSYIDA